MICTVHKKEFAENLRTKIIMWLAMKAGAAIRSQQAAIIREGEQPGNGQN